MSGTGIRKIVCHIIRLVEGSLDGLKARLKRGKIVARFALRVTFVRDL